MTDPVTYLLSRRAWGRLAMAYSWCFWLVGGVAWITDYGWGVLTWMVPMVVLINVYGAVLVNADRQQRAELRRSAHAIAD